MTKQPFRLTLLALGLALPAAAQTPLFSDGTAFGGSKVFSEGLNPLGNPANLARPGFTQAGYHFCYVDGGQEAKDFRSALNALLRPDGLTSAGVLKGLKENPWGLKTKAYGLAYLADEGQLSWSRESTTALWSTVAASPTDTPPVSFAATRAVVDRLAWGVASKDGGGIVVRIERWATGSDTYDYGTATMLKSGVDPYAFNTTTKTTTAATFDVGYRTELAPGMQFGLTIDRIIPKKIGEVDEKAQGRAGLLVDIGSLAQLVVEADVNAAQRMPFPVKQRVSAASLVMRANPSLTFTVGAEQRKLGDAKVTRTGVTVRFRSASFSIGAALQFGQDTPLRGGTFWMLP